MLETGKLFARVRVPANPYIDPSSSGCFSFSFGKAPMSSPLRRGKTGPLLIIFRRCCAELTIVLVKTLLAQDHTNLRQRSLENLHAV